MKQLIAIAALAALAACLAPAGEDAPGISEPEVTPPMIPDPNNPGQYLHWDPVSGSWRTGSGGDPSGTWKGQVAELMAAAAIAAEANYTAQANKLELDGLFKWQAEAASELDLLESWSAGAQDDIAQLKRAAFGGNATNFLCEVEKLEWDSPELGKEYYWSKLESAFLDTEELGKISFSKLKSGEAFGLANSCVVNATTLAQVLDDHSYNDLTLAQDSEEQAKVLMMIGEELADLKAGGIEAAEIYADGSSITTNDAYQFQIAGWDSRPSTEKTLSSWLMGEDIGSIALLAYDGGELHYADVGTLSGPVVFAEKIVNKPVVKNIRHEGDEIKYEYGKYVVENNVIEWKTDGETHTITLPRCTCSETIHDDVDEAIREWLISHPDMQVTVECTCDPASIRQEISALKVRMATVESKASRLESDVAKLQADVQSLENFVNNTIWGGFLKHVHIDRTDNKHPQIVVN